MITKENFSAYRKCQDSGKTNMMDIRTVSALTGLDKDKILEIIKNYDALDKKYATLEQTPGGC